MKAKIYSKLDCPYCVSAKDLLKLKNIEFEELVLGIHYNRDELKALIPIPIERLTVPQIWIDSFYIGGYTDLERYLNGLI